MKHRLADTIRSYSQDKVIRADDFGTWLDNHIRITTKCHDFSDMEHEYCNLFGITMERLYRMRSGEELLTQGIMDHMGIEANTGTEPVTVQRPVVFYYPK